MIEPKTWWHWHMQRKTKTEHYTVRRALLCSNHRQLWRTYVRTYVLTYVVDSETLNKCRMLIHLRRQSHRWWVSPRAVSTPRSTWRSTLLPAVLWRDVLSLLQLSQFLCHVTSTGIYVSHVGRLLALARDDTYYQVYLAFVSVLICLGLGLDSQSPSRTWRSDFKVMLTSQHIKQLVRIMKQSSLELFYCPWRNKNISLLSLVTASIGLLPVLCLCVCKYDFWRSFSPI